MDLSARELDSALAIEIERVDDPGTKAVMESLNQKRRAARPLTNAIKDLGLAFLTAKPGELKELIEDFPEFCKSCQESGAKKANDIIEAIVDRYAAKDYDIDCDTLTFIGIHLNKQNFRDDATRCWRRAEEIIST